MGVALNAADLIIAASIYCQIEARLRYGLTQFGSQRGQFGVVGHLVFVFPQLVQMPGNQVHMVVEHALAGFPAVELHLHDAVPLLYFALGGIDFFGGGKHSLCVF